MDAEYISLRTVRRIDFYNTGCSGEYLAPGVEGGGGCREIREGKMLIPEETSIFYCIENAPKANAAHVLNRNIFFF